MRILPASGRLLRQAAGPLAALFLSACAVMPDFGAPPPPALPDWTPARITDAASAQAALDAAAARRAALEADWQRQEFACYRRFRINGCLADVRSDRLVRGNELDRLEIAARAMLRDIDAIERNREAAQAATEAAQRVPDDAAARERSVAERVDRLRRFEEGRAKRAQEDAARPAYAAESERRLAEREATLQSRREAATRKAAQADANRAARERRLAEQAARKAERSARQAERSRERAARAASGSAPAASGAGPDRSNRSNRSGASNPSVDGRDAPATNAVPPSVPAAGATR